MQSIGIAGFGNMGESMGLRLHQEFPDISLYLLEPNAERAERGRRLCNGILCESFAGLVERSDICIIAVKPQYVDDLLNEVDMVERVSDKRYITIVAGKSIDVFSRRLRTHQVIRFMPNLAATVGKALVGMCYEDSVEDSFREEATQIANTIGTPLVLPERLIAAVTGISGSGIAYVLAFIHALALGGTHAGIPYADSLKIAGETLNGAVALVKETGCNPIELLTRITSAAGTTIEGLSVLEESNFTSATMKAVVAAANRAKELEE